MNYVNFNCLPNQVFSKPFEEYLFFDFYDFLSKRLNPRFMSAYAKVLKEIGEPGFSFYEVRRENYLHVLYTYDAINYTESVISDAFWISKLADNSAMYEAAAPMRCVLAVPSNSMCIYAERFFELVVIGGSKKNCDLFKGHFGPGLMDLDGLLSNLQKLNGERGKEHFDYVKAELTRNYA